MLRASWACCVVASVETCSSSSSTDSSLSDSVPDSVSAWGSGNSCSVAGTIYLVSLGSLCQDGGSKRVSESVARACCKGKPGSFTLDFDGHISKPEFTSFLPEFSCLWS